MELAIAGCGRWAMLIYSFLRGIDGVNGLIDDLNADMPEVLEECENLIADRGLDDGKLITRLWDDHSIKAVIDIRNLWRDGEETRLLKGRENIVHDYRGTVYCCCPQEVRLREMAYRLRQRNESIDAGQRSGMYIFLKYGYICQGANRLKAKNLQAIAAASKEMGQFCFFPWDLGNNADALFKNAIDNQIRNLVLLLYKN